MSAYNLRVGPGLPAMAADRRSNEESFVTVAS